MANTRETMGEQACLDALVANTLTNFEDDGVTKIGGHALSEHKALESVNLSQCKSIESYGLANCTNLETLDIHGGGTIYHHALYNDDKFAHLLIRGDTKTTLQTVDAIAYTPLGSGRGAVYVPPSLLADYKADNLWKFYFITTLDKYPLSEFSTIEDDWATIISKAEAGTASGSYSIGDIKEIDLGANGKIYAQIAGFGLDTLASDSTKTAGITFVTKRTVLNSHIMNPANSSGTQGTGANGGWEYSEMRTYVNDTILPIFPSQLQAAIKSVTKYSSNIVPGESTVTKDGCVTQDKLWIPSHREILGESTYEETGPIYSSLFPDQSSRIKLNKSGLDGSWWLRSASTVANFRGISNDGSANGASASNAREIVLGFCI